MIEQIVPWFDEKEKQAIADYMNSGGWLTEHLKTCELEAMISEFVGSEYCFMVPNGTLALYAALFCHGVVGEVIVPAFTMMASATAIEMAGAIPKIVDINRDTFCLDLQQVKDAITDYTEAIMVVSINGRAPDMAAVLAMAEKYNLIVIEDAAQSLGSQWNGQHIGTFGHAGCFSFSHPKVITTGQGGCIVLDDIVYADTICQFKNFGRMSGGGYDHDIFGINLKFTDLQAVIGIEQMKKLSWRVERKQQMFKLYREQLVDVKEVSFIETDLENVSPWYIDVLVEDRVALMEYLKVCNIGTRRFYPSLHQLGAFAYVEESYPNAEYISRHGLWLPSSSFLKDSEIEFVCESIRKFYEIRSTE